jgi:cyclophilin family peptidyl-prolyl cis-trans isomerase
MNDRKPTQLQQPELTIDQNKTYAAVLKTSEGDIVIDLHAAKTPVTVNNFVYLAGQEFYNNTIFHRVIKGFMIQGGDPTGTGSGGPGYRFDDEPFDGSYTRGTVAMANAGPNTNGSQFFIMHADNALPKNYVIFGNVTQGLDVVDKIATAKTGPSLGGEQSKPENPVVVTSVQITQN